MGEGDEGGSMHSSGAVCDSDSVYQGRSALYSTVLYLRIRRMSNPPHKNSLLSQSSKPFRQIVWVPGNNNLRRTTSCTNPRGKPNPQPNAKVYAGGGIHVVF